MRSRRARIHAAINEDAKNPLLASTYRSVKAGVKSLRIRTNQNEAKWKRAVAFTRAASRC